MSFFSEKASPQGLLTRNALMLGQKWAEYEDYLPDQNNLLNGLNLHNHAFQNIWQLTLPPSLVARSPQQGKTTRTTNAKITWTLLTFLVTWAQSFIQYCYWIIFCKIIHVRMRMGHINNLWLLFSARFPAAHKLSFSSPFFARNCSKHLTLQAFNCRKSLQL